MCKILFFLTVLGLRLSLAAQFNGDAALQQAFTTYMQERMAPEPFQLDRLDTVIVRKGDLGLDGVDDAAIQWREGQEQRIVVFSKKDDGYEIIAEADCVWNRQKRMVFDLTSIHGGWLHGRITKEWRQTQTFLYTGREEGRVSIAREDTAAGYVPQSNRYLAYIIGSEILGLWAGSLAIEVANDTNLKCNAKDLLMLSWPLHHLGKSSILWDFRFKGHEPAQIAWDQTNDYLRIRDPLGSEMEDTTTLISKIYPARNGRQLIVITWQEGTNAEWDSQDHWAAFWDHGKWIPAMDSVLPPLDGRIFFDSVPDNPDLLHEGWQVALHIDRYTNEIVAAPANKLEIIQAAYPDLVAQMHAPQVRYVWNQENERFEVRAPRK